MLLDEGTDKAVTSMRICPTCKKENEDQSRFCESCGAPLEEGAQRSGETERACPSCHKAVAPQNRYCTNCGQKVFSLENVDTGRGKLCPGCGTTIDPSDAFCGWCGYRIAPAGYTPEPGEGAERSEGELKLANGPRLTVLAGREKDKVYQLGSAGIRLGRSRENDVCLDTDGYVSSHHARIYQQGNDFYIEDAGSVNGTFTKVRRPVRLEPGDELKIGQSLFRFDPGQ